ncbi:transposase [Bacillus cereus]|uniref:transposase n=1 Tax=Bacillus cereus TaxID=1396 RepID=UPI0009B52413|nr:transposase [Bacillus cereus]
MPISTIAKQLGRDIRTLHKYINLSKRELSLLFMTKLVAEHIEEILNHYPLIRELLTLLYQFQKILTERQSKRFAEWIHQVEQLAVPEIKSFINGIKRETGKPCTSCICTYPYSNGVAEVSVDKAKL